ncbi:MAG: heavy metal-binding domain-containing protein [Gammaproteobacteria bacterium]
MRTDCKLTGREAAFVRMRAKADREQVHGVVGVSSELRSLGGEANAAGAEEVVGIKTYIIELGSNLVEIFAVGTAVKKLPGIGVKTQILPPQAIIRDKDTWVSGSGGVELTSIRAGE